MPEQTACKRDHMINNARMATGWAITEIAEATAGARSVSNERTARLIENDNILRAVRACLQDQMQNVEATSKLLPPWVSRPSIPGFS